MNIITAVWSDCVQFSRGYVYMNHTGTTETSK